MTELMDILANGSFWVAVLRTATPLLLGTSQKTENKVR